MKSILSNLFRRSKVGAREHRQLAALLLLSVNLIALIWYVFVGYQASFHSDSAAKVLLAREIVDMRDYFPDEWNYVNKDLFVLFGHTFIIPLLAFMPAGFKVHAISGLISVGLILTGVWLLTGLSELGKTRRLLIVAAFAAGISPFMAENLYGQVSYGVIFYFSAFIVFLTYRFLACAERRRRLLGVAVAGLIFFAFWQNPQRGLICFGLPLAAAMAWYQFSAISRDLIVFRGRRMSELAAILFFASVIGIIFHWCTIVGVNDIREVGHARWLTFDEMLRNIGLTFKGYLAIMGGLPPEGEEVATADGVFEAARLGIAILFFVLAPHALYRAVEDRRTGLGFLAVFSLSALLIVLFVQFFTTVPTMSDPIGSSRYLVPSIALLIIVLLAQNFNFNRHKIIFFSAAVILAVLMAGALRSYSLSIKIAPPNRGLSGHNQSQWHSISRFLISNNLHYGYSSYWNASVLSVLSDEAVRVRAVHLGRGLPPRRHLSSNRWYKPDAWQGETFLLLSRKEIEAFDVRELGEYGVNPVRQLAHEDYIVYVFADNLAAKLPGWDTTFEKAQVFPASKWALSQVGKFIPSTEITKAKLVAEKGDIGALHYGPYVEMAKGDYVATFDVQAEHNPNGVVRLDVAAAPDQKLLAEKKLEGSNAPVELNFKLDKSATVEFRVWALGSERVSFTGVSIARKQTCPN